MYIHRGVLSYYRRSSIVVRGIAHGIAEKKPGSQVEHRKGAKRRFDGESK